MQNLETPCEGERVVTFCVVQKVTKKHTGRSPATRDSNLRSIHDFSDSDRPSSCNRLCGKLRRCRVSPADLNRCEFRALQRKDLERTTKEEPYSLQTVGYGRVEMGGGGRIRDAFGDHQGRFVQMKGIFSAHARPTDKEKSFFSTAKLQLPTAPKLTSSYKFYLRKPTVSLQYKIPFS